MSRKDRVEVTALHRLCASTPLECQQKFVIDELEHYIHG